MSYVPVIVKIISLNYFVLRMYCLSCNELYSCVCEAYFSKLFSVENVLSMGNELCSCDCEDYFSKLFSVENVLSIG